MMLLYYINVLCFLKLNLKLSGIKAQWVLEHKIYSFYNGVCTVRVFKTTVISLSLFLI